MAEKVRLRATITWEYDADPDYYNDSDPAAMASVDQEGLSEDPAAFLMDDIDPTITIEVVD